ncbi:MAG TPA: hypothetical protein VN642_06935 [Dongiaceae bacterium]|nr:hypothetical protein [Dongiaceae bacterium]
MRSYLENIKHITSLMAFIAALLVSLTFATASNAVVVPDNPVIGNPVAMNAVVPPMMVVQPMAVKAVNSDAGLGVRPFGLGVRPFGLGVRPFGFGVNPFFNRPFGFGFNPFFNRPFGFGFNPFFGADIDAFGADFD